ncbi:unnamed protein product [Adineta ricciae]|uniref:Uncharacterized protein n=1 Tax=Adineta ricciae TaxID=249248 RepID=A0A815XFU8_ADIRI|nr:unnamed protein product [Adineta ricciae]CAF1557229.1 unnamed protein product [Adineta ricciae]
MKSIPVLLFIYFSFINLNVIINAQIDCTIYSDDIDIINLNPFYVRPNRYPLLSSIDYNATSRQVTSFNIFNDQNPSSNIYCLKNLQSLRLINTNLPILSDIKNFQNLTSLIIQSDNGMINQHLPSELGELTSMNELALTDIKNLEDLPDEIEYLVQLRSLTLKEIPNFKKLSDENMRKLVNLYILNLIDLPNLSNIPSTINNYQFLQRLEITKTNINKFELENLNNLSSLKMASNLMLKSLKITDMLKLSSIDISYNNELLELKIQNLNLLQSFTLLSNTKLISLEMENISTLQSIWLTNSEQLKTITFNNLSSLSTFESALLSNLQSISFENLPLISTIRVVGSPFLENISFTNLPLIKELDLSNCQLKSFPQSILSLKSLKTLTMQFNQLSSLPSTLSNDLPNLQILKLMNNKFQEKIFQPPLIYIRELYLNNNSLTSLDGIAEYKSLQRLDLPFNQISSIPLEIMKLSSTLQMLSINSNRLITIPYQMTNMRTLKTFNAANNNITFVERQKIVNFFRNTPIGLNV